MRFAKRKGGAGALEAHHERTKEKYASNPDIDTSKSKHNFHIVKPTTSYKQESDNRIEAAGCKTRKDSVRFVDTLITASPDFFKGKKRDEVRAFFQTAVDFLSRKIGRDNIFAATVHMDEKTPHRRIAYIQLFARFGGFCTLKIDYTILWRAQHLMTKKIQKGINKNEQTQGIEISNKQIEILARRLLPEIKKFFANEDIRKEFEEWQKKRREGKTV
jgi:Plasmid recombination enzyme.